MLQMMKHPGRLWLALAVLGALIAGHGVILYYVSSHMAVSTAVITGVIVLVAAKHLGLFGTLYTILRKARRRDMRMGRGNRVKGPRK
jgi:hypothetical protein